MRSLQLSIVALALSGCIVPLTGAPCSTDDNCPSGQHCAADRTCQSGSPDKGDGGASVDSGVACQSDPGCDGADKPACDPAGTGKLVQQLSPLHSVPVMPVQDWPEMP